MPSQDQPPDPLDLEIERLFRAEDDQALRLLLARRGGKVLHNLTRDFPGVDRSTLLDAMSLALERVWRARARFDPRTGSCGGWFALIAHRCALTLLARRGRFESLLGDRVDEVRGTPQSPLENLLQRELLTLIHRLVAQLPRLQREALLANLDDDVATTMAEQAAQLGCSVKSLREALSRGKRSLREMLSRLGHAPLQSTTRSSAED